DVAAVAPRNVSRFDTPRFIPPQPIGRGVDSDGDAAPRDVFDELRPEPQFIAPPSLGPDPYEPPPVAPRAAKPLAHRPAFIAPADPNADAPTDEELDAFIARQTGEHDNHDPDDQDDLT